MAGPTFPDDYYTLLEKKASHRRLDIHIGRDGLENPNSEIVMAWADEFVTDHVPDHVRVVVLFDNKCYLGETDDIDWVWRDQTPGWTIRKLKLQDEVQTRVHLTGLQTGQLNQLAKKLLGEQITLQSALMTTVGRNEQHDLEVIRNQLLSINIEPCKKCGCWLESFQLTGDDGEDGVCDECCGRQFSWARKD